jgi:RNA polymerase sigma-70 factor, ECF subfamily
MSSRLTDLTIQPLQQASCVVDRQDHRTKLEAEVVALFDQFRDPLLRYLLCVGMTMADSEEIIQEVFLALFQHLQRGKGRDHLRGWLFRVAHRLALKQRYRTNRSGKTATEEKTADTVIDPAPNPEERFINNQVQQRLCAVFQALPQQERQCLTLRAEGLRYREIAKILQISLGAVSISLARSLVRMMHVAER